MSEAFPLGKCEICSEESSTIRASTCAINLEGQDVSHELCEMHYGAMLCTASTDDCYPRIRVSFRGHSSDLWKQVEAHEKTHQT